MMVIIPDGKHSKELISTCTSRILHWSALSTLPELQGLLFNPLPDAKGNEVANWCANRLHNEDSFDLTPYGSIKFNLGPRLGTLAKRPTSLVTANFYVYFKGARKGNKNKEDTTDFLYDVSLREWCDRDEENQLYLEYEEEDTQI